MWPVNIWERPSAGTHGIWTESAVEQLSNQHSWCLGHGDMAQCVSQGLEGGCVSQWQAGKGSGRGISSHTNLEFRQTQVPPTLKECQELLLTQKNGCTCMPFATFGCKHEKTAGPFISKRAEKPQNVYQVLSCCWTVFLWRWPSDSAGMSQVALTVSHVPKQGKWEGGWFSACSSFYLLLPGTICWYSNLEPKQEFRLIYKIILRSWRFFFFLSFGIKCNINQSHLQN